MATTDRRDVPPQFTTAAISLADSGNLVAAVTGKKILVWRLFLTNSDSTKTLIIKSGSTALTGALKSATFDLQAVIASQHPVGMYGYPVFETAAGEALVATLSAAADLVGFIHYTTA